MSSQDMAFLDLVRKKFNNNNPITGWNVIEEVEEIDATNSSVIGSVYETSSYMELAQAMLSKYKEGFGADAKITIDINAGVDIDHIQFDVVYAHYNANDSFSHTVEKTYVVIPVFFSCERRGELFKEG